MNNSRFVNKNIIDALDHFQYTILLFDLTFI